MKYPFVPFHEVEQDLGGVNGAGVVILTITSGDEVLERVRCVQAENKGSGLKC
jgi:hypothetical protein